MSRSNKDFMSWIRGYVRNYAFLHVFLVTACIFLPWWIKNGANDESGIFAELRQFGGEKCASLPHTDSVFVIMKTGTTVLHKRLPVHLESTFKCIPDYIVYSDASESVHGLDIHDILSQIDAEIKDQFPTEFALYNRLHGQESSTLSTNQGWKLDKWKFLPMMKSALGARPNAMWFIFIEDDTAVVWSNLLHWLATHDPSEFYYFGRRQEVANRPFAHGGSGFILSNPALRKAVMYLMPRMNQYFNLTMQMSYGDISTGWMLEDSGVSLIDTWPSFQGENPGKLQYTEQIWCRPVMTHHHMSPRDIASLWMLEQRTLLDRRDVEMGASLLHRDVFKALIRPKLVPQLENWDNGRGDERFAPTVSECQDLCISDETCVQFRFTPETCRLSSYVRFGIPTEPRFEITSGWLPDRIDRLYGKFQCRE
ncbi:hypothetical protein BGW36DRAFT_390499 [Talaromyces proteolyticus]|uniref:N-acetylgalactosaminide beta-1,3-galactosyltransferase n=1 Tax=Talaromyces proteolyticus TaxID=1131652 RepID=A0AAD4KKH6_9EURO|nr:uncharacterized protein BGW36DRAFT_390499 [Talaromyces proteolyticus]KAH8690274.1 hypothetical protein BGW36DRAFT_390499 [Talaromyces proteolyticus]